jgi:phytol kinase
MEAALTIATAVALTGLFSITQWLAGRGVSTQITRRLAHVVGAVTASLSPLYLQRRDFLLLGLAFCLFLSWTSFRHRLRSIHEVARGGVGAQTFPLGLALAAAAAWPHPSAFSFAALVLGLADPAAAIVGTRVGGYGWRIPLGRKTAAGSSTFFAVTLVLAIGFGLAVDGFTLAGSVVAALVLAAIEAFSQFGLDNLVLPLSAALLGMMLLGL